MTTTAAVNSYPPNTCSRSTAKVRTVLGTPQVPLYISLTTLHTPAHPFTPLHTSCTLLNLITECVCLRVCIFVASFYVCACVSLDLCICLLCVRVCVEFHLGCPPLYITPLSYPSLCLYLCICVCICLLCSCVCYYVFLCLCVLVLSVRVRVEFHGGWDGVGVRGPGRGRVRAQRIR